MYIYIYIDLSLSLYTTSTLTIGTCKKKSRLWLQTQSLQSIPAIQSRHCGLSWAIPDPQKRFLNQLKMNKFWASSGGPYPWFKSRVAHGLGKPEACFETLGFTRKPQVFHKSTAFLTRVDHGLHAGCRRSKILTQTFRSWMLSNSRNSKHSSFNPKISLNIGCVGFIVWSRVNPGFYLPTGNLT